MIRNFEKKDLNQVMNIWLNVNIEAHNFISDEYWIENYNFVKQILPTSIVLVYEEDEIIKGFVGIIENNYIAGLFVSKNYQNKGIGSELIKKIQADYDLLNLNVYSKNQKAINFYLKHDFIIMNKCQNEDTNELELSMTWKK